MGRAGDLSGYSEFELKLLADDLLEQLAAASGQRRDLMLEQLADIRDEMLQRVGD
jgi:hypothetical protein